MKLTLLKRFITAAAAFFALLPQASAEDRLLIVGDASWGGWSLDRTAVMVKTGESPEIFTYTGFLKADKEFKFLTEAQWDKKEYRNASDNPYIDGAGTLRTGGSDSKFKVRESANYTVECNLTDMTVTLTKAPWQDSPILHNVLYLVGDATPGGWTLSQALPLYADASDPFLFSARLPLKTEGDGGRHATFKIATNCYADYNEQKFYFRDEANSSRLSEDGTADRQWSVDASGDYDVNISLSDGYISLLAADRSSLACWYESPTAAPHQPVTVYFNTDGLSGELYALPHAVLASGRVVDAPRQQLAAVGGIAGRYSLGMTPSVLYGLSEGDELKALSFTLTDAAGNALGEPMEVPFANGRVVPQSRRLGAVRSWTQTGSAVAVQTENGVLELTAYDDYVVKVFTRFDGSRADERRSISVCAEPSAAFSVTEQPEALLLSTGALTLRVGRADAVVTFLNADGRELLREREGLNNSTLPRTISFEAMGDRAFYGGGYNGKHVNQDGVVLTMDNTQTGGWDCTWDAPHNICIPFVVSASGYGILVDDHYRGARLTPSSADGTTYISGSPSPVAYYFVGSEDASMASVLENYTALTGRQPLPPYWALGYMSSRYGYKTRAEAEKTVSDIKDMGLPLDAIVFDLYWQGEGNSGMGNLDWYAPNWPDAPAMMAGFRQKGVQTVCITEPFFTSVAAKNYADLKQRGFFADDDVSNMWWLGADKVGLIDSSNPEAMDWMWDFYKKRTQEGVGGWWLDLGEPESHDADSRHAGGSVGEVHNEFSDLWTERVCRGFRSEFPDVRPFLMPRAGTAGMQRHCAFPWSGDIRRSWEGLRAQVPALLSSGMSGVAYMGSDVSGFATQYDGHTDARLYLRWVQMAVFSPMMRTHSTYKPEPYHSEYASVADDVCRFIHMRYSYLPYTYTLAWENATKGTPLARPINFHDAASDAACTDEYLWGRDLLVAPVMDAGEKRDIVFPAGKWVDMNDFTRTYAGGTTASYSAAAGVLPHFGRKGAFITRFSQEHYDHTGNIDNSRLTVTYLADAAATEPSVGRVFDDDRHSPRSLEQGKTLLTTFTGMNGAGAHSITIAHEGAYDGMPASRRYTFVVPGFGRRVLGVTADDGTLFAVATKDELSAAANDVAVYAVDGDNLLIALTLPTDATRTISIALDTAGVGSALAADSDSILFDYSPATGMFSYAIPGGGHADIEIHDLSGAEAGRIDGLRAGECVGQVHAPALAAGLYIATLTASYAGGAAATRSLKAVIR